MSYREKDIKHEAHGGRYWVLDTGKAYAVMVVGVTHSYLPKDLPAKFDKVLASWDCTFKDTDGTDFVVGQVWGKAGANAYLLGQVTSDSAYERTPDGLSIAVARCNYLAARRVDTSL